MYRENYIKRYESLKLSEKQKKRLLDFLEELMKNFPTNNTMQSEGAINTFNNLFFFILGDGEVKDMFENKSINYKSVKELNFNDFIMKKQVIDNSSNEFIAELFKVLSEEQFILFHKICEELFVTPERIVVTNNHLKNDYQYGYYIVQKSILKNFEKIKKINNF